VVCHQNGNVFLAGLSLVQMQHDPVQPVYFGRRQMDFLAGRPDCSVFFRLQNAFVLIIDLARFEAKVEKNKFIYK
jgi:hypothetical protein